ncbi:hypothetical protein S4A8_12392 [Salinisphaera sp. S4-8]|uniref:oxygenase MpaB family protein n=1 Tax=Salinisphaera sp. S4-8 TaxID=633357 RepID=UPI00333F5489
MPHRHAPPTDIPRRHGIDRERSRAIAAPIRRTIQGDPEPTPECWQAIGHALMQGDTRMDDVVAWLYDDATAQNRRQKRALFQAALDNGLDTLEQPPPCLRTLFAHVDHRPAWVDDALLERGARVSQRSSMTGLHILRDVALMGGYQASAINKTLVATGSLKRGAQRRLAETTAWWLDCTGIGALDRFGVGFRNTLQVRFIHALIRRSVQQDSAWSNRDWGLPVNQADMASTQLGFSVIFLLGTRVLGVPISGADGHAVMHLWRFIGWLMGVDERWLAKSEQDGRRLLYALLLSQAPPDESSRQLGRALMNEPLARPYPNLAKLRARYIQARANSLTRLFVGRRGMHDLGLPAWMPPWYPVLAAPRNFMCHTATRLLPGGLRRAERAGRHAQLNQLQALFPDRTPRIHRPVLS